MNQEKLYQKIRADFEAQKENIQVPEQNDPIIFDSNAELNLVLWGDPQVSSISPLRAMNMAATCQDLANAEGTADALILLGDVTEYGMDSEFQMVKDLLQICKDKYDHLIAVPGNHDIRLRNYKKQCRKFQQFLRTAPKGISGYDDTYFNVFELKGYKFILLGSDRTTLEGAYLGTEQLNKLDAELAKSNGKPTFVINHQTLRYTNGLPNNWLGKGKWRGSVGWESKKLKAILEKHQNVFFITGHLHWTTNEHTVEDYGAYKALSIPTVGVINHGPVPEPQCFILSLYKEKAIARARFCAAGKYMDKSCPCAEVIINL